jgi:tetratricopeptide (TPR) repeat protein
MRCGQLKDAAGLLRLVPASTKDGSLPIALFTLAEIETRLGSSRAAELWSAAKAASLDYCFPSRLEEMQILKSAIAAFPAEPSAYYLLGNWLYDRRRHEEAIQAWESAARLNPRHATVWRNLGIAMFNIRGSVSEAKAAFDLAFTANPKDGRILYERDQLWKRIGVDPTTRVQELERHMSLVSQRDDLFVELATLYNQLGRPEAALELLSERQFQPWEGGEGLVLAQYVRARTLLGKQALRRKEEVAALEHFRSALQPPQNLGEAKHLLANQGDLYYWIGRSYEALGQRVDAATWWKRAAHQHGDFQRMSVCSVSEMTYWAGMADLALGEQEKASRIFESIYGYSVELEGATPKIDYFATSLPTMLLFDEDLALRNRVQARFLRAQALVGLNRTDEAETLLEEVLHLDRNHTGAVDLIGQLSKVSAGAG